MVAVCTHASWVKRQLKWAGREADKVLDSALRLALKAQIAKLKEQATDDRSLKGSKIVDPIYGIIARKPFLSRAANSTGDDAP
eukprot:SAG22_NODE_1765_length_3624_cov_2.026667_2_plen_83_part_00